MHPALLLLLTLLPAHTPAQQTRCQWATLRSATDQVLESLSSGLLSPDSLLLTSPGLNYTQNGVAMPLASATSILTSRLSLSQQLQQPHSLIDQDACAAFIKLVASLGTGPDTKTSAAAKTAAEAETAIILAAQIRYVYTPDVGTTVAALDLVYARQGDWKMMDAATVASLAGYLAREDWGALSWDEQERNGGREVLDGVARGYLNFLGDSVTNDTAAVEWGRPCARLEGAVYVDVKDGESCVEGVVVGGGGMMDRKVVVDMSVGGASVLARDGRLGGAPTVLEFRVVDGRLRYVHEFAATAGNRGMTAAV